MLSWGEIVYFEGTKPNRTGSRQQTRQILDPVFEKMAERGVTLPIEVQTRYPLEFPDFKEQKEILDGNANAATNGCCAQVFRYTLIEKEDAIESRLRTKVASETRRIQRRMEELKEDPEALEMFKREAAELRNKHSDIMMLLKADREDMKIAMSGWSSSERVEFFRLDTETVIDLQTRGVGPHGRAHILAQVLSALDGKTRAEYPESGEFIDILINAILQTEEDESVREDVLFRAHMDDDPRFSKETAASFPKRRPK